MKVTFTAPQKEVLGRIQSGENIYHVNAHHMSGGQLVWQCGDSVSTKVLRAVISKLMDQEGVRGREERNDRYRELYAQFVEAK